jgi:hypothetical protein
MSAVVAAKEKTGFLAGVLPGAETRVWGVGAEMATLTGAVAPLSSTAVWGWGHWYGGTASGRLDPVNYADPEGLERILPDRMLTRCFKTETGMRCEDIGWIYPPPKSQPAPPRGPTRGAVLSPQEIARGTADAVQSLVAEGAYSDCEGLAAFASDMSTTFGNNKDKFVASFGILTPRDVASRVGAGAGVTSSSSPVFLNSGQASGYKTGYQNTTPDNASTGWNGDQGHHFAAFFQLGYQLGGTAGSVTSAVFELLQATLTTNSGLNMGDVQLGIDAALMGAGLKAGTISTADLAGQIRQTLCQQ